MKEGVNLSRNRYLPFLFKIKMRPHVRMFYCVFILLYNQPSLALWNPQMLIGLLSRLLVVMLFLFY